jgi:hypothetical protein
VSPVLTGDAAPAAPDAPAPRGRSGWQRRAAPLLPLLPTALAAGLIGYRLGWRSLWLDEGDTFTTASQHGAALWHWALNDGGNMLTYYLGMHVVIGILGSSETVLRLPGALAGVATVPVAYALLRRLFDRRAALFGSTFVAVSLPFVFWSQQARAYSLGAFLLTASTLALVVAVEERRRWAYVAWAVLSVLAVYTILLGALGLVAQAASLSLRKRGDVPWRPLAVAAAAGAALCVPLAIVAASRGSAPIAWLAPPGPLLGSTMRYLISFLASSRLSQTNPTTAAQVLLPLTLLAWAGGVVLCVLALARHGRSREAFGYGLLLLWLVLPVVVAYLVSELAQPVIGDRYLVGCLPAGSMLAGVVCSRLRPLPVAAVAGVALIGLRATVLVPSYSATLENWRSAAALVATSARANDCIAFFVADGYTAFDYYLLRLDGSHPSTPNPVLPDSSWASRTPYVLDPAAIAPAQLPSIIDKCPRMWLVTSHNLGQAPGPGVLPYRVEVYRADRTLTAELAGYAPVSTWSFVGVTVQMLARPLVAGGRAP